MLSQKKDNRHRRTDSQRRKEAEGGNYSCPSLCSLLIFQNTNTIIKSNLGVYNELFDTIAHAYSNSYYLYSRS